MQLTIVVSLVVRGIFGLASVNGEFDIDLLCWLIVLKLLIFFLDTGDRKGGIELGAQEQE